MKTLTSIKKKVRDMHGNNQGFFLNQKGIFKIMK